MSSLNINADMQQECQWSVNFLKCLEQFLRNERNVWLISHLCDYCWCSEGTQISQSVQNCRRLHAGSLRDSTAAWQTVNNGQTNVIRCISSGHKFVWHLICVTLFTGALQLSKCFISDVLKLEYFHNLQVIKCMIKFLHKLISLKGHELCQLVRI